MTKNEDGECVYTGTNTYFLVQNLEPFTKYSFSLQLLNVESKEKSSMSEPVVVQTEDSLPNPPSNLRILGSTTTIIKIAWDPPDKQTSFIKSYCVYKNDDYLDQTYDNSYILSGLQPDSTYDISVCAVSTKGKGERSQIKANTCSLGDTIPEKPLFGLIGKREILVKWQSPQLIIGKLTRYELKMNENSVYSGVDLEYQVTMLKPDTEYKFEVNFYCLRKALFKHNIILFFLGNCYNK